MLMLLRMMYLNLSTLTLSSHLMGITKDDKVNVDNVDKVVRGPLLEVFLQVETWFPKGTPSVTYL